MEKVVRTQLIHEGDFVTIDVTIHTCILANRMYVALAPIEKLEFDVSSEGPCTIKEFTFSKEDAFVLYNSPHEVNGLITRIMDSNGFIIDIAEIVNEWKQLPPLKNWETM